MITLTQQEGIKMENIITISHDGSGRFEVVRRLLDKTEMCDCQWCGNRAKFEYGIWYDGINTKPSMDGIGFCSIRCRNTYFS